MTKTFKLSLCALALASPFSLADSQDQSETTFSIGAEVLGGTQDTFFTLTPSGTIANATDLFQTVALGNYAFSLGKVGGQHPDYVFGARVLARMLLDDHFEAGVYVGAETAPKDTKPVFVSDQIQNLGPNDDHNTALNEATIKQSMTITPGAFIMYDGIGFTAQYDMREYEFSQTSKKAKDEGLLFGLRGEANYNMDSMDVSIFFEYLQSFGRKVSSELKTELDTNANAFINSGAQQSVTIGDAHTNMYKGRIGLSFNLTDL